MRPNAATLCSFSAGCSDTWACRRGAALARPRRHHLDGRWIDGAHRVDGRADSNRRPVLQGRCSRRPAARVAVGEAALRLIEVDVDAALQVAGVEQRDAQSRLGGRGDQRCAITLGSSYGTPSGPWWR